MLRSSEFLTAPLLYAIQTARQKIRHCQSHSYRPPILILDESTGALDPLKEAEVLDKLLFYRQGKTTIMISHRPRVINRADWIVLLENGELKE